MSSKDKAEEQKNQHGGARPGSGRPKTFGKTMSFKAPKEMAEYLESMPNRSEFIKQCVAKEMGQADYKCEIEFIGGEFNTMRPLFQATEVIAGFPSPAADYMKAPIDFNRDMIPHPETTFYVRVVGDSMIDAGIEEGDLLIVDKSLTAQDGDIIIAFANNEFTVKYLDTSHKSEGYIELVPANKNYPRMKMYEEDHPMVWGVVTWTLRRRH